MKKFSLFYLGLLFVFLLSCQEKEEPIVEVPSYEELESEWIRLGVWNQEFNFSLMHPLTGNIKSASLASFHQTSANYLSSSGRYIVSIERNDGIVRFFDTGIENHRDHGHEYAIRWLNATALAPLPTHFSATQGNIVIFNDGDGSITYAREASMETPTFSPAIISNIGNGVHHGAATWLRGNKFAVTFKDEGTPGALPQRVKLLNLTGEVVAENANVFVTGIHGDASNGDFAVFGGTQGVIVAGADNKIKLIANPSPLQPTSGNWMGTIKGNDEIKKFYGYARNQGVFEIDPLAESIKPIFLSNEIRSYFLSADGGHLIIQTSDNAVRVFDTNTGSQLANRIVTVADEIAANARKTSDELMHYRMMSENNPVITASENFLYVLEPNRTKIHVRDLKTLAKVGVMDAPANTSNIMRIGFQVK